MENSAANMEISKEFSCSKETLFNAWTRPDELKQWWKPMGRQLIAVENDLKEGGEVKYSFEDDSVTIDGRYKNVVENELLVYTWNWHVKQPTIEDAAYTLTVKFDGDAKKSTLTVTQEGFATNEHVQPHRQGWKEGLQQLHDHLVQTSDGSPLS